MMPQTAGAHAREGAAPMLHQATPHPSTADLCGFGFVLIIAILIGRQLAINLHEQRQLHRIIVSLQRRATLERQWHRKSASKPAFRSR